MSLQFKCPQRKERHNKNAIRTLLFSCGCSRLEDSCQPTLRLPLAKAFAAFQRFAVIRTLLLVQYASRVTVTLWAEVSWLINGARMAGELPRRHVEIIVLRVVLRTALLLDADGEVAGLDQSVQPVLRRYGSSHGLFRWWLGILENEVPVSLVMVSKRSRQRMSYLQYPQPIA